MIHQFTVSDSQLDYRERSYLLPYDPPVHSQWQPTRLQGKILSPTIWSTSSQSVTANKTTGKDPVSYHMIHQFTVSDSQLDYRERSYLLPYDPPVHSQWQPTRLQGKILSPTIWFTSSQSVTANKATGKDPISYHMIHQFTVSDSQQGYRERSYLLPYDPPVHSQWQPTRLQGKILSPTIWSTSSQSVTANKTTGKDPISYHMIHQFTVSDSQQDYRERSYLLPYDPPVHSQWQPTRLQGKILSPTIWSTSSQSVTANKTTGKYPVSSPTIWSTSSQSVTANKTTGKYPVSSPTIWSTSSQSVTAN